MKSFEAVAAAHERRLHGGDAGAGGRGGPAGTSGSAGGGDAEAAGGGGGGGAADGGRASPAGIAARVLKAYERKNYGECLQLPPVYKNAMGRPVWDVSTAEITSAYKRLAVLIHPDKYVPSAAADDGEGSRDGAVEAFQALHNAYRALKDPAEREAMVQRLGERAAPMPGLDDTSFKLREKVKLQREEASGFAEEIKKQMAAKRRLAEERLAAKGGHGGGDRRVRGGADAGGGGGGGAPGSDEDGDDSDDSGRGGGERGQRAHSDLLRRKKRKTVFM